MPEFKPTIGTANVYDGGTVIAYTSVCILSVSMERVPCLILPMWRPIAECPEAWKDGRRVMLHTGTHWVEAEWLITQSMWACAFGAWLPADYPDFIMLPPPAPEVEKGGVR